MEASDLGWPAALAAALVLPMAAAAIAWLRRRSAAARGPSGVHGSLDTLTAWEPQATRVLTDSQRAAHELLVRAFPGHVVLAQVPLARFLRVPTRHSYREWLRRVGGQCADLLICDPSTQALAVVSVRPAGARSERSVRREARLCRVLQAAQIPVHLWMEGTLPSVDGVRRQIDLPPLPSRAATPADRASAGHPGHAGLAPAHVARAANPLDLPVPDEVTELREPPASTWFDDLDSRTGGLDAPDPAAPRA